MLPRWCIIFAALGSAATLAAKPPATLEQRIVAVIANPAPAQQMRSSLARLRPMANLEQMVTIDSFQSLIDGYLKSDAKALADAQAFAAAHPRSGGALLSLAFAQLRSEQIEVGADSMVAGIAFDPGLADALSNGNAASLIGQLRFRQDHERLIRLARGLFDAGWTRGTVDDRSFLASQLILADLKRGDQASAMRLLPIVRDPQRLYVMLVDNRFAGLRGAIEQTSGARLDRRWREYLIEARDTWTASGEADDAIAFVTALQRANLHGAVVAQFLPRFTRGYNCPNDPVARSLAPFLVSSLVSLGQLGKAENVLARNAGAHGRIDVNILSYHYVSKGRFSEASSMIERMLASLAKSKTPIEDRQTTLLRSRLACANARRGQPTGDVATNGLGVGARLWVARCLDRPAEAKRILLEALDREPDRLDALSWLQPDPAPANQSAFELALRSAKDRLIADPEITAAVARYGVVLDWPSTAGVPADLAPARPKRPPPCGTIGDTPSNPDTPEDLYERRRPM